MNIQETSTPSSSPSPELSEAPAQPPFRVIAYVTDAAVPAAISYNQLTHINYAFLIPNDDGTFAPILNQYMVGELIKRAHENGVKVIVSVGGWGWDAQFEKVAADASLRALFIQNLKKVMTQYGFDGADIDWEYPDEGVSSQNFLALMLELRAALPKNALLTAAVVALGQHAAGIPDKVLALMDYVNIMAYDNNSGDGHSSLAFAREALDYWLKRGVPPEKAVLGMPFYGRGVDAWTSEISYAKIVKADPAAAQLDLTTIYGLAYSYNGIPTIQAKTRLALEKGGGVMFWTLDSDAPGDLSLLNAIHQVVVSGGK